MSDLVLIGDVGGTNSRFAMAELDGHAIKLHDILQTKNDGHADFESVLADYLESSPVSPSHSLFALAGPVDRDGSVKLINRDWPRIDPINLRRRFGLKEAWLVNDFAGMARAIPELPQSAFESILPGTSNPLAPIIVTGPGTGFGISALCPLPSGRWHVVTGEGGHSCYTARTPLEAELHARMQSIHGYVATEMIVGGAWLQAVFDVVSDIHGRPRKQITPTDVLAAAEQNDAVAQDVLLLRSQGIMNAVGDLVLVNGGHGGAVLTGSVAHALIPWLKSDAVAAHFYDRGGHSNFVEDVPVRVLTDSAAPLIGGAALLADRLDP